MAKEPLNLREEIRQTKPFESPAQEAILGIYRTSDMLQRRFARLVEPHGISLQQYNVLRILRGGGKQGSKSAHLGGIGIGAVSQEEAHGVGVASQGQGGVQGLVALRIF